MDELDDYEKYAKDIDGCENCPLSCGGWKSDGNGEPVEPPCMSWNDDTIVSVSRYEDCD